VGLPVLDCTITNEAGGGFVVGMVNTDGGKVKVVVDGGRRDESSQGVGRRSLKKPAQGRLSCERDEAEMYGVSDS
jgi:hypothetical protein